MFDLSYANKILPTFFKLKIVRNLKVGIFHINYPLLVHYDISVSKQDILGYCVIEHNLYLSYVNNILSTSFLLNVMNRKQKALLFHCNHPLVFQCDRNLKVGIFHINYPLLAQYDIFESKQDIVGVCIMTHLLLFKLYKYIWGRSSSVG